MTPQTARRPGLAVLVNFPGACGIPSAAAAKFRSPERRSTVRRHDGDVREAANFTATRWTAAESGYRREQSGKDILQARASVRIVLAALSKSVKGPNLDLLGDEEMKTAVCDREFVLEHPQSPEIVLTPGGRWENGRAKVFHGLAQSVDDSHIERWGARGGEPPKQD